MVSILDMYNPPCPLKDLWAKAFLGQTLSGPHAVTTISTSAEGSATDNQGTRQLCYELIQQTKE